MWWWWRKDLNAIIFPLVADRGERRTCWPFLPDLFLFTINYCSFHTFRSLAPPLNRPLTHARIRLLSRSSSDLNTGNKERKKASADRSLLSLTLRLFYLKERSQIKFGWARRARKLRIFARMKAAIGNGALKKRIKRNRVLLKHDCSVIYFSFRRLLKLIHIQNTLVCRCNLGEVLVRSRHLYSRRSR